MFVFPDLIVFKTLTDGFAGLQQDPSPITDILKDRPESEVADLTEYLAAHSDDLKVKFGYPRSTADANGIYVSLADTGEVEGEQTLGSSFPDDEDEDETSLDTPTHAVVRSPIIPDDEVEDDPVTGKVRTGQMSFRTTVRVAVRAMNAALAPLLATLVFWTLLANRLDLENQGLREQTLAAMDFVPDPSMQPDLIFQRDVRLTCIHIASTVEIVRRLQDIGIMITPVPPTIQPTVIVVRNRITKAA